LAIHVIIDTRELAMHTTGKDGNNSVYEPGSCKMTVHEKLKLEVYDQIWKDVSW
jgi:hypothetical protein